MSKRKVEIYVVAAIVGVLYFMIFGDDDGDRSKEMKAAFQRQSGTSSSDLHGESQASIEFARKVARDRASKGIAAAEGGLKRMKLAEGVSQKQQMEAQELLHFLENDLSRRAAEGDAMAQRDLEAIRKAMGR